MHPFSVPPDGVTPLSMHLTVLLYIYYATLALKYDTVSRQLHRAEEERLLLSLNAASPDYQVRFKIRLLVHTRSKKISPRSKNISPIKSVDRAKASSDNSRFGVDDRCSALFRSYTIIAVCVAGSAWSICDPGRVPDLQIVEITAWKGKWLA